jgi:hypothetical protein
VVCGAPLFILPTDAQAGLEPLMVVRRNGANFSQCSVVWEGFPQARAQDVTEFDSG